MNLTLLYAFVLLGNIALVVLLNSAARVYRASAWRVKLFVLVYLRCGRVLSRHTFFGPFSVGRLVLYSAVAVIVGATNIIGVHDRAEARSRTGVLCAVNAVPLFLSTRLSLAGDALGLDLHRTQLLHSTIGITCLLEGVAHAALSLGEVSVTGTVGRFGLLSVIALSSICLLTILRSRAYELFISTHILLAGVFIGSAWLHIRAYRWRFFVLGAMSLVLTTLVYRTLRTIFRNATCGERSLSLTKVSAEVLGTDLIKVDVYLPRPWKLKPGQYAYLILLEPISLFQSHPFMIVSEESTRLQLVVRPARGWTEYVLWSLTRPSSRSRTAFLDGPYGGTKNFGEYGTVIIIATGIGIFAQIPFIKGLFDGYREARIRTQRLRIFWQIEYERCTDWCEFYMPQFLKDSNLPPDETEASFFKISLFVLRDRDGRAIGGSGLKDGPSDHEEYEMGRRLKASKGPLNAEGIVSAEIKGAGRFQHGGLLISVSAEVCVREDVKRALRKIGWQRRPERAGQVGPHYLRGVELLESPFQPHEEPLMDKTYEAPSFDA